MMINKVSASLSATFYSSSSLDQLIDCYRLNPETLIYHFPIGFQLKDSLDDEGFLGYLHQPLNFSIYTIRALPRN
jgi:hypothetical protein